MRIWTLGLVAGAAAILAGCGGERGGTSTVPPLGAQSRAHNASSYSGDLLYILTNRGITIVSYPDLQVVGNITNTILEANTICSDPNTGNVYLPQDGNTILVYAHGGTTPIATLRGPSGYTALRGCSVNPLNGDLAVDSAFGPYHLSGLEIFPGGTGTPTVYTDKKLHLFDYTAYDDSGDLFVTGFTNQGDPRIGELLPGQSTLIDIRIKQPIGLGKIQWDGTYLAGNTTNSQGQDSSIYRLQIHGTKATVAETVSLKNAGGHGFWIDAGDIIAPYGIVRNKNIAIAVWLYPSGGKSISKLYGIVKKRGPGISDVTLSVSPSH